MSLYNNILKILNLKDKNIIFDEDFFSTEVIKGIESQVYHGTLTYIPKHCPKCGCIYDNKIVKHGFKTSLIFLYLKYLI